MQRQGSSHQGLAKVRGREGKRGEEGRRRGEERRGVGRFIICNPPSFSLAPLPSPLSLSVPAAGDTEERTELAQPSQQLSTLSATSLHSGDPPAATPTSIFLQAASYLLDVHALKVRVRWSNSLSGFGVCPFNYTG